MNNSSFIPWRPFRFDQLRDFERMRDSRWSLVDFCRWEFIEHSTRVLIKCLTSCPHENLTALKYCAMTDERVAKVSFYLLSANHALGTFIAFFVIATDDDQVLGSILWDMGHFCVNLNTFQLSSINGGGTPAGSVRDPQVGLDYVYLRVCVCVCVIYTE